MARAVHSSADDPSQLDIANGAPIAMGVRATTSVAQACAGVAFYVPATNSGTYTGELYQTTSDDDPNGSGTGTLLATKSVSAATVAAGVDADGWYEIVFDDPVDCSTGVVYTLSVHSSSGRYVRRALDFQSQNKTGNDVTLLQAGTDPNPPGLGSMSNGVFIESATPAYPNSTFEFADYYIDWVLLVADQLEVDGNRSGTASVTGAQKVVRPASGNRTGTGTISGAARQVARVATALSGTGAVLSEFNVRSDQPAEATTNSAGWYSYLNILRNQDEEIRRARTEAPSACPACGEPLDTSVHGILFCQFDGWKWSGVVD